MFNKENSKTNSTVQKSPTINMISEGTHLKGDIQSDNDIRISGTVEGEASSKGRVILTSSGRIDGNVKAKDGDIAGKMNGEVHIIEKLILRESAVINGDIHTKTLLVEEGAQINGHCKMGAGAKTGTPDRPVEYSHDAKSLKQESN